jgi:hypothetical protein
MRTVCEAAGHQDLAVRLHATGLADSFNATLVVAPNQVSSGAPVTRILSHYPAGTTRLESALIETVPGNGAAYTATVRGLENGTGVGLVEVYALN